MHHVILGKPRDKMVVDHINGNSLDNRRENLRFATHAQNSQNVAKRKDSASKYIGVTFHQRCQKWRMQNGNYRKICETEEEAAKLYDKYVLLKYGPGARTNGFLVWDDVKDMELEVEFEKKKKVPVSICKRSDDRFDVSVMHQGQIFKSVKHATLEFAMKALTAIQQEVKKLKDDERNKFLQTPIQRNKDGVAFINIKNKAKDVISYVLVDDEHWHDLSCYTWTMNGKYVVSSINKKPWYMHIYLMHKVHGYKPEKGKVVDHINRVPYDNRLSNLRINTCAGNVHNKTKKPNASSRYIGVFKEQNAWKADIKKDGVKYKLGRHETQEDAARAYNSKALELFLKIAIFASSR